MGQDLPFLGQLRAKFGPIRATVDRVRAKFNRTRANLVIRDQFGPVSANCSRARAIFWLNPDQHWSTPGNSGPIRMRGEQVFGSVPFCHLCYGGVSVSTGVRIFLTFRRLACGPQRGKTRGCAGRSPPGLLPVVAQIAGLDRMHACGLGALTPAVGGIGTPDRACGCRGRIANVPVDLRPSSVSGSIPTHAPCTGPPPS